MGSIVPQSRNFAVDPEFRPPLPARVKILHPVITTAPPMHAEILGVEKGRLQVRVPRSIVVGSTVQVRSGHRIAFGAVRSSVSTGTDYQIDVHIERLA